MPKQGNSKKVPSQASSLKKLKRQLDRAQNTAKETQNKKIYKEAKAREKELKLKITMTAVKGKGIYDPKGDDLTKYRKTRLNKIAKEFGDFFDISKFEFIPVPKDNSKTLLERATGLDFKTTRLGLFAPKNHYSKVQLKKDKKRNEFYIERSGKTKWGINSGRKYRSITPLASVDELSNEIERIKNMGEKLGPLGKNERLTFEVNETGNEGYSHATFKDIKSLMNYLDQYLKTTAAKLQFYRHISIVKTESVKKWFQEHPPKMPKKFARRVHTKPSVIRGKPR